MRVHPTIQALAAVAVLGIAIAIYCVTPPVTHRQMAMLSTGCSTNDVIAVLGPPSRVVKTTSSTLWCYSRWWNFKYLELAVSPDGQCSAFHFEP